MNPELLEDEDVCEDICGGTDDDEYNALEDEACCGDQAPATPSTHSEPPAHLPSIVLDGANAVADSVANTLGRIHDGANAVTEGVANALSLLQRDGSLSRLLQQSGQGALENVIPKPIPDPKNDVHKEAQNILEGAQKLQGGAVDGVLRKIKEYKLNQMEQMEREKGHSEESILRKLKEGATNPDKQLDGTNTNRGSSEKEARMMMIEAMRAIGVLPRPASDKVPVPGATTPIAPAESPSEKRKR